MHKLRSFSNGSLYTDVVLFFFSVNKSTAVFIFYHARSMDFEEKIEGLWSGYSNGNENVKKTMALF